MRAQRPLPVRADHFTQGSQGQALPRRAFLRQSLACAGGIVVSFPAVTSGLEQALPKPLGVAKGIHPGRVVWAHDPEVTDWKGPGDGHWWEGQAGEAGARGRHDGAGGL